MPHSRNLRAIGQSIELAQIEVFELQKHGQCYLVRSPSMTPDRRWVIKDSLLESFKEDIDNSNNFVPGGEEKDCICYDPRMLSCLTGQGQKKRRHYLPAVARPIRSPSQYLRTLGDQLDRTEARTFIISWNYPKSVSVIYKTPDYLANERIFGFDKLDELGFHMRLRRSRHGMK